MEPIANDCSFFKCTYFKGHCQSHTSKILKSTKKPYHNEQICKPVFG